MRDILMRTSTSDIKESYDNENLGFKLKFKVTLNWVNTSKELEENPYVLGNNIKILNGKKCKDLFYKEHKREGTEKEIIDFLLLKFEEETNNNMKI